MSATVAGKYRLVRKLASGGMGEVFLAVLAGPQGIEKRVVIKRVRADAEDADLVRMFADEARVAADLHHPNVVDVYEVGEDAGGLFLAMEFLEGHDLRRIQNEAELTKRPMPLGPALHVIADAARGLHYAHEKRGPDGAPLRIVHRDVSPQNILVTRDGMTKVLDFGIAKANMRDSHTDPGLVKGKIAYMSPEQATGSPLDRRSDLWSLGVVLYEVTTTRRLFESGNLQRLISDVARAKVDPPSKIVPSYPKPLEEIVMKCLAARPSERWLTGDALATALEELLDDEGIPHSASKVARYLRTLFGDDAVAMPSVNEMPTAQVPVELEPVPVPEDASEMSDEKLLLGALKELMHEGVSSRKSNVVEPDALLGREDDESAVRALLADGARLVTIHGPAGVGKTALAKRITASVAGHELDSAWLVDLSEARTLDALVGAVGSELGVPVTGADAIAQLGRALAARGRVLLVLDTFEQLIPYAAVIEAWMKAAPSATFLVTSRERLRLQGERVHELAPLATETSVDLFVSRARRVRARWEPRETDLAIVRDVVSRLEGLPLAIELAAARIAVLSPEKILELLPRRLDLLKSTDRSGSARKATLRATLDWSWDLLEPWERDALADASVFHDGFDLDAAEAVIDLRSHRDAPWTLDVLQSLVDKSLLRAWEPPSRPGETRFGTWANVRQWAAEKLAASGRAKEVEARHGLHYLTRAREWVAALETHGGSERRRRLLGEMQNLQAVLERAIAAPRSAASATDALHAALAMDPVLSVRGPLAASIESLDSAISAAEGADVAPTDLAAALLARGRARRVRGRVAEALEDLARALPLAQDDRGLTAEIRMQAGAAELHRGGVDAARALYIEALDAARAAGDRRREAMAEDYLATLPRGIDPEEQESAAVRFRRALAIDRQIGAERHEAAVLGNYAYLLRQQGRFREALDLEEKALARYRELGDRVFESIKLGTLAGLHLDAGNTEVARKLYGEALRITRDVGNRRSEGFFLGNSAILAQLDGELEEAREGYEKAIEALDEVGDPLHAALYSAYLASALAASDKPVPAERHLERAREGLARAPMLLAAADVLAGTLELARSARTSDPAEERSLREAAAARLVRAKELADRNEDVRFAARLLERALRP